MLIHQNDVLIHQNLVLIHQNLVWIHQTLGVDPPKRVVDPPNPCVDPPKPGVDPPKPGVDPSAELRIINQISHAVLKKKLHPPGQGQKLVKRISAARRWLLLSWNFRGCWQTQHNSREA